MEADVLEMPSATDLGSDPPVEMLSLRRLKALVRRLPRDEPVRDLIEGEPDEIPREEYAIKMSIWWKLLKTEGG